MSQPVIPAHTLRHLIHTPILIPIPIPIPISIPVSTPILWPCRPDICLHIYVSQLVARLPSSWLHLQFPSCPRLYLSSVALALASVHFISHLAVAAFPFLCLPAIHSRPLAVLTGSWRRSFIPSSVTPCCLCWHGWR